MIWHAIASLAPRVWNSIPDYLPFYLLATVVIYATIRGARFTTVISPFHLPPGGSSSFSGDTVANTLRDTFLAIRKEAVSGLKARSGELIDIGPSELAGLRFPDVAHFEVPTRFAVEIRGLSHEALISVARKVLGRERVVSGDVILHGRDFHLLARCDEKWWESGPCPSSAAGLRRACRKLSLDMLETLDPQLLAAYQIARGQFEAAYNRLRRLIIDAQSSK